MKINGTDTTNMDSMDLLIKVAPLFSEIVSQLNMETFGALIGTLIDQFTAKERMTDQQALEYFSILMETAKDVHAEYGMMEY